MDIIYDELGFNPVAWFRHCIRMACDINEPTILPESEFASKFREAVNVALLAVPENEHEAALVISNEMLMTSSHLPTSV